MFKAMSCLKCVTNLPVNGKSSYNKGKASKMVSSFPFRNSVTIHEDLSLIFLKKRRLNLKITVIDIA